MNNTRILSLSVFPSWVVVHRIRKSVDPGEEILGLCLARTVQK